MKYPLIFLLFFSVLSCQTDSDQYKVTGNVENVQDGQVIYLSRLNENNQPATVDSVTVENERFSLALSENQAPNLNFLTLPGYNGNVMFISESEPIHIEMYKDSLQTSKVTGGKENRLFYDYLGHLQGLNEQVTKIRTHLQREANTTRSSATIDSLQREEGAVRDTDIEYKKNSIRENPDAFVSILMLSDMHNLGAPYTEVSELYDLLSSRIKDTQIAQTLKEDLDKRSATEIGNKAPAFSGPNPQGEEIALNDVMGKVTLIDFWAAWCRPCRVENPNIVNVYNKYHDKGFNIVGISLDRPGERDRWLKAIEDDNLTWPQISSLEFWQDPIAQKYGIRAIPAAFLLDENGIIVARDLRGEDLENKVREMLEE